MPSRTGVFEAELMGFLQEFDGQGQHVGLGEGQVIPKNRQFVVARGKPMPSVVCSRDRI